MPAPRDSASQRGVLVTGASGFIGAALCRELAARGHAVRAAARHLAAAQLPAGVESAVLPDLASGFDACALLDGVETVVHLAAIVQRDADAAEIRRVNVEGALRLAEASAGRVRRFVYLSSAMTHGAQAGDVSLEENSPLAPRDAYGRAKLEAERLLAGVAERSGIELVVLRPPLVYGPGVKGNFLHLLRWIGRGVPLPLASVRNRRSLIYVGNLASAIVGCVEHPAAAGQAFLVADAGAVSTPELARAIAAGLHRPARLFALPAPLLAAAALVAGQTENLCRLTESLEVDCSLIRTRLGWRPPFTFAEGIAASCEWFLREQAAR